MNEKLTQFLEELAQKLEANDKEPLLLQIHQFMNSVEMTELQRSAASLLALGFILQEGRETLKQKGVPESKILLMLMPQLGGFVDNLGARLSMDFLQWPGESDLFSLEDRKQLMTQVQNFESELLRNMPTAGSAH